MLGDISTMQLSNKRDNDNADDCASISNNATRMLESTKNLLGVDKKGIQRALFLYDGGWGVWKFLVGFVIERDSLDHFRFAPIQTNLAQNLCQTYGMPSDISTAVLFTDEQAYTESDSILRMFYPYLKFPYFILGFVALFLIPKAFRDVGYRLFARNRGKIWSCVKRITRMGDTVMVAYRDSVLGLEGENFLPESWGFHPWESFWLALHKYYVLRLEWRSCSLVVMNYEKHFFELNTNWYNTYCTLIFWK